MRSLFSSQKKHVYLDHAAATPLDAVVREVMLPYMSDIFGNPSALYAQAQQAKEAVDTARKQVATVLAAQSDTIIFTSGGTESTNMAVFGVTRAQKKGHIITTAIEHPAVLHPCQQLEQEGFTVTYLEVDDQGLIRAEQVKEALRPDTILVSIMYANNEVGSVQPIADIGRVLLQWRKAQKTVYPLFHTDACQAAGALTLNVEKLHVDLLSANGSKIYGPKGIGILYVRRGVELLPLMYGGGQEMNKRSGTESVANIVGFAKALTNVALDSSRIANMREYLWKQIQEQIPDVVLHGPALGEKRLPNNLNVSFLGAQSESVVVYLDAKGIAVGTGSACATGEEEGSHVLRAMGKKTQEIESSVRFSLGKDTTKQDIAYVMKHLPAIVKMVRGMTLL